LNVGSQPIIGQVSFITFPISLIKSITSIPILTEPNIAAAGSPTPVRAKIAVIVSRPAETDANAPPILSPALNLAAASAAPTAAPKPGTAAPANLLKGPLSFAKGPLKILFHHPGTLPSFPVVTFGFPVGFFPPLPSVTFAPAFTAGFPAAGFCPFFLCLLISSTAAPPISAARTPAIIEAFTKVLNCFSNLSNSV
jgi:hypothetical protein